ncbi:MULTISPECIES: alpha/beta fold hydrolase [unclassified Oceanobacter]|uniref:alpha/beta fold hydrolase n=1 Tax=unclassified Oceanobacter TaxID=2620260 RepID=UPI0027328EEE|nr:MULTISPECIES: alpha/beta fold hydrolase [unclassified Oceanobacter]MDP2608687.1 alpha/beta fold hydrolase [Oceanobacter sp. 1_MG-2023]MDP2611783.1 alpha/beta fold hydrolase [Oceanobacter sp. 2_MG-2023]
MKSSSALFPVTLARADNLAGFTDDVYLVKHNLDQDRSVEVAVTHLSPGSYETSPDRDGRRPPVVLLHGSFTNRSFWLTADGDGLAAWLVRQGFDVWLMEQRGHGLSPRNIEYTDNTAQQYACYDVPAVNDFVCEKTGEYPAWIGHSLGGVVLATAIAAAKLHPDNCAGVVSFGAQVLKRPWYLWMPLGALSLRTLMSIKGELDGLKVGIGPENEPAGIVNEYLARQAIFGKWQLTAAKQPLLPAWRQARVSLRMFAGVADRVDPLTCCRRFYEHYGSDAGVEVPKSMTVLGTDSGFSEDYDHSGMVNSPTACHEVWPLVGDWLGNLHALPGNPVVNHSLLLE